MRAADGNRSQQYHPLDGEDKLNGVSGATGYSTQYSQDRYDKVEDQAEQPSGTDTEEFIALNLL